MKNILLDASSAILLFKAELFHKLVTVYTISCTRSVLQELIRGDRCGADTFLRCSTGSVLSVIDISNEGFSRENASPALRNLDRGELDTVLCFTAGGWDFIITDDGRAAKYCRQNNIPFINAILFPRLLYFCHAISLPESIRKMEELISLGRYSREVIEWAMNCGRESLHFAIPDICGIDK